MVAISKHAAQNLPIRNLRDLTRGDEGKILKAVLALDRRRYGLKPATAPKIARSKAALQSYGLTLAEANYLFDPIHEPRPEHWNDPPRISGTDA